MSHWAEYAKQCYYARQHRARFVAYVKQHGLPCQECGGRGGERYVILDDGTGPWEACGWCEGTGHVTRRVRGQWLRWKQQERKERAAYARLMLALRARKAQQRGVSQFDARGTV